MTSRRSVAISHFSVGWQLKGEIASCLAMTESVLAMTEAALATTESLLAMTEAAQAMTGQVIFEQFELTQEKNSLCSLII